MTREIIRRFVAALFMVLSILVIAVDYPVIVYAAEDLENTQLSMFLKALQPIDAKAEPDDSAETIFSYDEDSYVYVTGETDNGWYIVYYQDQTGYINKNLSQGLEVMLDVQGEQDAQDVQDEQSVSDTEKIDLKALDEELAAQELEGKVFVEEVERHRTEVRRSRIWGVIIALLVIGIFAVGIVSTVRAEKKKKEDGDISEEQQENGHDKNE